jgi:hypothetical protein
MSRSGTRLRLCVNLGQDPHAALVLDHPSYPECAGRVGPVVPSEVLAGHFQAAENAFAGRVRERAAVLIGNPLYRVPIRAGTVVLPRS